MHLMKQLISIALSSLCVFLIGCQTVDNRNAYQPSTANSIEASQNAAPTASPTTAQTTAPGASIVDAEETTPFEGTSGVTDKKGNNQGVVILKDVRDGRHDTFDRIVFEFAGTELAGYHIEYVDKPVRACGSGDVVPLAGDGWLEIRFSPAAAHTEAGEATVKQRTLSPGYPILRELKSTCDFEAEVEWVAGVSSPNKYRVLELRNPTRLAVDIKHGR